MKSRTQLCFSFCSFSHWHVCVVCAVCLCQLSCHSSSGMITMSVTLVPVCLSDDGPWLSNHLFVLQAQQLSTMRLQCDLTKKCEEQMLIQIEELLGQKRHLGEHLVSWSLSLCLISSIYHSWWTPRLYYMYCWPNISWLNVKHLFVRAQTS